MAYRSLTFGAWGCETMAVAWNKDADAALGDAKTKKKPLLVDFSAAPA